MKMQLDAAEVQTAVADYLRKRGVVFDDTSRVQIEIVSEVGGRINIVGCTPVVVAINVKLPEGGPYR